MVFPFDSQVKEFLSEDDKTAIYTTSPFVASAVPFLTGRPDAGENAPAGRSQAMACMMPLSFLPKLGLPHIPALNGPVPGMEKVGQETGESLAAALSRFRGAR